MTEQRERPRRRPKESAEQDGQQDEQDGQDEQHDEQQNGQSKEVARQQPMKSSKDGRTDTSATLRPLADASPQDWLGSNQDPDVLLAIPNLGVDHIGIEVDNLKAHVELHAKVLDLLELHVGAQVSIEKVDINIENVRVQAMLKVNLDEVSKIVGRVMDTIDANPEILTNLTGGLGKGLQGALEGGTSSEKGDQNGQSTQPAQDDEDEPEDEQGAEEPNQQD